MPFRFRFKSLLQQREYLLQEAQSALAAAQLRHRQIQARINEIKEQIKEQGDHLERKQREGMDAGYYLSVVEYIQSLERQLLQLEHELRLAAIEVEKQKKVVIERDKAVKTLEILQEKDREEYRRQVAAKEQKQLDEVAIFKNFRERTD